MVGPHTYRVQPGDTPTRIAIQFTRCPKCARDLVLVNPQKRHVMLPNGFLTFTDLRVGEELRLPNKWFDGTNKLEDKSAWPWPPGWDEHWIDQPLVGLGDVASDLAASPEWADILKQLKAEGVDPATPAGKLIVDTAQQTFVTQFTSLTSNSLGVDIGTAKVAAKQFVLAGQTIAGAVTNINGIIEASKSGVPPQQVALMFTGTLIGLAAAGGLIVPGVGAAIMLGVGFLLKALPWGDKPAGTLICGTDENGMHVVDPKFVIGCVAVTGCDGQHPTPCQIQPGSSLWRHFPVPSSDPNSPDAGWFEPFGAPSVFWPPAAPIYWSAWTNKSVFARPIDVAFPEYRQLECELANSYALPGISLKDIGFLRGAAVIAFLSAFFAAWRMNKEYALNGLKPREDWEVLLHTLRVWNRAHEPGDGFDFEQSTSTPIGATSRDDCTYVQSTYASMLVNKAVGGASGTAYQDDVVGGKLHLNTGNQKTTKFIVPPGPTLARSRIDLVAAQSASTSMSTTSKVLIGTAIAVGLGALSLEAYARMHHMTFGQSAKHVWSGVTSKFHRTPRMGGRPMRALPRSRRR